MRSPDGQREPGTAGASISNAPFDALLPPAMARRAEEVGVAKLGQRTTTTFVLAVLAGVFIAFGAMMSTVVTAAAPLTGPNAGAGAAVPSVPFGVGRLLGGLTFCLGLVLVVIAGAELFTGNTLVVMAWASRRVKTAHVLRSWGIVYVGNLVGGVSTALLVYWSGHTTRGGGAIGRRALEIARVKTDLSTRDALLLGVLANVLVCLAVWLTLSARTVVDKVVAIVFPITAFVTAGFEHSIANMYFVPAGLFIKDGAPATFWTQAGSTESTFSGVTWRSFLGNLVPVTIGNVIGGALLVGLVYWFVYLRNKPSPVEPFGPSRNAPIDPC